MLYLRESRDTWRPYRLPLVPIIRLVGAVGSSPVGGTLAFPNTVLSSIVLKISLRKMLLGSPTEARYCFLRWFGIACGRNRCSLRN